MGSCCSIMSIFNQTSQWKKEFSLSQGWPKYDPPASQIPCTFFSSTTFPTVDSTATGLAESVNKSVILLLVMSYTTFKQLIFA